MKSRLGFWKYGALVIGIAILALLIIDFNSRLDEWRRLSLQREQVGARATSVVQTHTHLETRIAYATSPAGVAEWAYQDGHWVRPGDKLVIPVEAPGLQPTASPQPVPTPQVVSNWQLWLSLFFDRLSQ
jgi:hypothetical protein